MPDQRSPERWSSACEDGAMAVKRCPSCGDLYVAAVDRCADCDVTLVEVADEPSPSPEVVTATTLSGDNESWELDSWTMEGRRLLDGMLATAEIPRVWQGATLVAPAVEHDRVADMVEVVARGDARVGVDDGTLAEAEADGGGSGGTVGYEVGDWSDDALSRLAERLNADGIPFAWDEDGDLVVDVEHEQAVDQIFDALGGDDEQDDDSDDGLAVHETLSEIFLAADRLARNALDMAAARSLAEASERASTLRLPFGFSPTVWRSIIDRSAALTADLVSDDVDDDAIEETAAALRTTLRDYI
jgi:hypothetical protein